MDEPSLWPWKQSMECVEIAVETEHSRQNSDVLFMSDFNITVNSRVCSLQCVCVV